MDYSDFQSRTLRQEQLNRVSELADKYASLAIDIVRFVEDTDFRDSALKLLLQSKMFAVHAISRES
jgi:hypothetical protein